MVMSLPDELFNLVQMVSLNKVVQLLYQISLKNK